MTTLEELKKEAVKYLDDERETYALHKWMDRAYQAGQEAGIKRSMDIVRDSDLASVTDPIIDAVEKKGYEAGLLRAAEIVKQLKFTDEKLMSTSEKAYNSLMDKVASDIEKEASL